MLKLKLPADTEIPLPSGKKIFLRRCDLIHPEVGGNKWFKLKYNVNEMAKLGKVGIATFGGPHSNHIAAIAAMGKLIDFRTIGFIRGRNQDWESPTLKKAEENGMKLVYLEREMYDQCKNLKGDGNQLKIDPNFLLVPEGGNNELGIEGCKEMLTESDQKFDLICCPVGTGATLLGLISSNHSNAQFLGFSALKNAESQTNYISEKLKNQSQNFDIVNDELFGGFAKMNDDLITFNENFYKEFNVRLDFVYTSKMIYKLFQMDENCELEKFNKILVIHTGGIQGNEAMLRRWK